MKGAHTPSQITAEKYKPVKGQDNMSPLPYSTSPIEIFSVENYLDKV